MKQKNHFQAPKMALCGATQRRTSEGKRRVWNPKPGSQLPLPSSTSSTSSFHRKPTHLKKVLEKLHAPRRACHQKKPQAGIELLAIGPAIS